MARIKLKYVNAFKNRERKNGRIRYYFRRRGMRAIPLPGLPGSDEFMEAYQRSLAGAELRGEIGADRTSPGTVNSLVIAYYKSAEWSRLAADTQKTRRRYIERFREEHGEKRVALLRRDHLELMLAKIAKPTARRHWLKSIRPLLQSAVPNIRKVDPTEGIKMPKLPKTRGHHSWMDNEIEQYRNHWPLGTQQRLVMEFALETASRRGEVVRLGPQRIRQGRIRIERTHGGLSEVLCVRRLSVMPTRSVL